MIHTVIDEGLVNEEFVRTRASNFEALKRNVQGYSAEAMAPICGIPGRDASAKWRANSPRRRPRWCCGAWASASMCMAPTTRAA